MTPTARALRRLKRQPRSSHERWMVSYADFVTLLFAFFTTMYAISTVDARKLGDVVDSMQAAFANGDVPTPVRKGGGPGGGGASLTPGPDVVPVKPQVVPPATLQAALSRLETRLNEGLSRQVADGGVEIRTDPRGLVVSLREAGAFGTGSAELSLTARAVLGLVGAALADVPNGVRVEGHTDDVPIHTTRYRSNWELSTTRATNVVAFLMDRGVPPARLSAAGYGEFHPRASNDSEVNRARNRRVDIVVLNTDTSLREEPASR
jgi:chemotaxis protein MotB